MKTIQELESNISDVQISAIKQLEIHGKEEVLSLLYPLQNSEDDAVGMAAKVAIYKIINREMDDADLKLKKSSEEMIRLCNDLDGFVSEFENSDFRMRMLLLKYFSMYHSFGDPENYSKAIQELLDDEENPFVKSFLIRVLMPFKDHVDFNFIRKFLKDLDPRVRANTVEFLGYLGGIDELPYITSMLEDKNPRVVSASVLMMRKFGKKEVIKKIKRMLESDSRGNVLAAFFLIGKIKVKNFYKIILGILKETNDPIVIDRGFNAAMMSDSQDELIDILVNKFSEEENSELKMKLTNMVVKLTGKFPEDFLPEEKMDIPTPTTEIHELPYEEMIIEAKDAIVGDNYTLSHTILIVLQQSELKNEQKIEVRNLISILEKKRNEFYSKVKREDYSEQIKKLFENVIDLDIPDVKNILLLQEFNPEQYIKMLIRLILESNMKARNYCIQKLTVLKDPMWKRELEKYKDHPDNVTRFHVRKAIENLNSIANKGMKFDISLFLQKYKVAMISIASTIFIVLIIIAAFSFLNEETVIEAKNTAEVVKVLKPGKEIFSRGKIVVINAAKGYIKIQSNNLIFELKMKSVSYKNLNRHDTVRFKCIITKVSNNFIMADVKLITKV
ncbi:HEAT repeat domain-containing protein [bacterium]|nr:HEAT repeat domain-containing protein [bacterium]